MLKRCPYLEQIVMPCSQCTCLVKSHESQQKKKKSNNCRCEQHHEAKGALVTLHLASKQQPKRRKGKNKL
jgi:hypothetical protein